MLAVRCTQGQWRQVAVEESAAGAAGWSGARGADGMTESHRYDPLTDGGLFRSDPTAPVPWEPYRPDAGSVRLDPVGVPVDSVAMPFGVGALPADPGAPVGGTGSVPVGSGVLPAGSGVLPAGSGVAPAGSGVVPAEPDVLLRAPATEQVGARPMVRTRPEASRAVPPSAVGARVRWERQSGSTGPAGKSAVIPGVSLAGRRLRLLGIPAAVLILLGVLGFVSGVRSLVGAADQIRDGQLVAAGRPVVLELRAGDERTLWVSESAARPRCRVDGPPRGRTPAMHTSSATVETNGASFRALGSFTAGSSGRHTVSCTGGEGRLTEGAPSAGMAPAVLSLLFGVLGFVLGVILLVAAVFGWGALRARARTRARVR